LELELMVRRAFIPPKIVIYLEVVEVDRAERAAHVQTRQVLTEMLPMVVDFLEQEPRSAREIMGVLFVLSGVPEDHFHPTQQMYNTKEKILQ
jgi:hypothetical protein